MASVSAIIRIYENDKTAFKKLYPEFCLAMIAAFNTFDKQAVRAISTI